MSWRQKLKRVIKSIPEKVPANEVVGRVIHYLKQRKCYEGVLKNGQTVEKRD